MTGKAQLEGSFRGNEPKFVGSSQLPGAVVMISQTLSVASGLAVVDFKVSSGAQFNQTANMRSWQIDMPCTPFYSSI